VVSVEGEKIRGVIMKHFKDEEIYKPFDITAEYIYSPTGSRLKDKFFYLFDDELQVVNECKCCGHKTIVHPITKYRFLKRCLTKYAIRIVRVKKDKFDKDEN